MKILGIGNALVDVIARLEDESFLKGFSLQKGGMEMIDAPTKRQLHEAMKDMKQTLASGGSTSNTIHGLARLGAEAGFIGKVSHDAMGDFFRQDMLNSHITPHLLYSDIDTGIATTLMTPDAERTFATYLGAAATMVPEEISREVLSQYDYIHVEGYLIFNRELILAVCRMAKECGLRVSMDMASYNIVAQNRDFIRDLLHNYVDVIFANEDEARAYTGKEEQEALDMLAEECEVAVVKLGKRGSLVKIDGETTFIPPMDAPCIDTNGAGDIYAAGFLYGLLNNYDAAKSGHIATLLATEMIQSVGAKLSDSQWDKIRKEIL